MEDLSPKYTEIPIGFNLKTLAKPWNGVTPGGRKYPYSPDGLMIDVNGTIWYVPHGEFEYSIWCPAVSLESHIHHLNQILARG